jgi:hypothetical protein
MSTFCFSPLHISDTPRAGLPRGRVELRIDSSDAGQAINSLLKTNTTGRQVPGSGMLTASGFATQFYSFAHLHGRAGVSRWTFIVPVAVSVPSERRLIA